MTVRSTQDALEVTHSAAVVSTQDALEVSYSIVSLAPAVYHSRAGRSFEFDVSFKLPPEERLYETPTLGANSSANPDPLQLLSPPLGYDEALDECFTIIQKGGDRTAPMSWALGVVNIGSGVLTGAPAKRVSNYALCWIWFDAPGWGANSPSSMKYTLTSGQNPVSGGGSSFSTQALRAILIHKFIEPGKHYNVAVQLQRDSGTPGSALSNAIWNDDGFFKVWVSEDGDAPTSYTAIDSGGGPVLSGMEVYKGPQDSIEYFIKYGVRYSARDALFWGLGFRPHVWQKGGFIPWGADAAPIQNGGYRMIDRSREIVDDIYGAGIYTLTASHLLGDAFVTINHRGFAHGNTNGGTAPMGFWTGSAYLEWQGLNAGGAGSTPFNPEALRGYRLVTTNDFPTIFPPIGKGMILNMLSYTEVGLAGPYHATISSGASLANFAATPVLMQAFRWHQRELEHCELRFWNAPRAYDDANPLLAGRRLLSLRSSIEIDDATEPDLAGLLARWAADDAGGSVIRETVVGGRRHGFFAPFGVGVSDGGSRGPDLLFLSGEGEALKVDFSSNPVATKLLERMMTSRSQGFAMEMTCVIPEALYGIQGPGEPLPDGGVTVGSRPRFVPDLMTWDVPDPDDSGLKSVPRTIIALTHRALRNDENQLPFMFPLPWSVEVANRTDQENSDPVVHSDLLPWYVSGGLDVARYDRNASWVGKSITIQVGIQPSHISDDSYDVYVAMRPKTAINPGADDPGDAEFAYFSKGGTTYDLNSAYFTGAHITIRARDLARSVVTIGGRWAPRAPQSSVGGLGYSELNARLLVDEVRIFATAGPGSLPAMNGDKVSRDGKLLGLKCLPARLLTQEDILLPLGRSLRQANVTERSDTVLPAGGGKFFTAEPEVTIESVKGSAFIARGDTTPVLSEETVGEVQEEFYLVESVAADGSNLTLADTFQDPTRSSAAAAVFRLVFYTAFADDLSQKDLSLGAGSAYDPATSTIADATIVDDLWANVSPVTATMGLRIYSPLGRGTLQDLLPTWVRGLVRQRKNPILGIISRNGDVFCGARGALYEGDDRWREEGPTDSILTSLAFRATPLPQNAINAPLHEDRLVFQDATPWLFNPSATDAYATTYDAWIKLDTLDEYQTIVWVGDPTSDPALDASPTGHLFHMAMRLRRGTPELVFGSQAAPAVEKGLYVASGATSIQKGEFTHLRWSIPTRAGGSVMKIPTLKINGRTVDVAVNAQDAGIPAGTASDWLLTANLVDAGAGAQTIVGASRDSYRTPKDETSLGSGVEQLLPSRIQGFLHSLGGELSDLVVSQQVSWTGSDTGTAGPNFDPFNLTYALPAVEVFHVLGAGSEGVGHKAQDAVTGSLGLIRSHPFVSLFHELGLFTNPISWAQFAQQIYATNGGRPAVVIQGNGTFAGVLPPAIAPTFTIERFPVWIENVRNKLSAADPSNDPIDGAVPGATPIYSYRSTGNAYFRQNLSSTDGPLIEWTAERYFGFKCFWRPTSVSGRVSIWRKGQSKESGGPFVECRDGKCVFGWYDSLLKKEVSVTTSAPVFTPGRVHYICIRKRFPQVDQLEGNWVNSYYSPSVRRLATTTPAAGSFTVGETISNAGNNGRVLRYVQPTAARDGFIEYIRTAGDFTDGVLITGGTSGATATTKTPVGIIRPMHDQMIVRELRTTVGAADTITALDDVDRATYSARNLLGFTTEVSQVRPTGTVATGQISHTATTYSTSATAGRIVAASSTFHQAMVGMYFQFGTGGFARKLYRITVYVNTTTIDTVIAGTTTAEVFGVASGLLGGVFTGISLIKSTDLDDSRQPDTNGDIDFLGTELQVSQLNGFAPHQGQMWTPGWTCVDPPNHGEGAFVFEDIDTTHATGLADPIGTGTDLFDRALYDGLGGEPGELHFNGTTGVDEPTPPDATFWTTDSRTYNNQGGNASSQPNGNAADNPSIMKDPAVTPLTLASKQANPVVQFIQDPDIWAGKRFVATAFFDPLQNAVSNPGPILTILPSAEDPKNPSGSIRFSLSGLPQRADHELWIYESLSNGDAATLFRVAAFPASSNEFAIEATEDQIILGPPLSFTNLAPPACKVIASTGSRMFFGALTALKQLDGIMYSKIGEPVSIRLDFLVGFFRLLSGFGDEITGLESLDESLLVTKDHALANVQIDQNDLPRVETISGGIGSPASAAVVALDDRVYLQSERGTHVIAREGVTNLGKPHLVSQPLENYFSFTVDRRYARFLAAAINRQRDQYVLIVREQGKTRAQNRVSVEAFVSRGGTADSAYAPSSHRYSHYETPNLSAIGPVSGKNGGQERIVGGTDDGFLVWMDDTETQAMLLGPNAQIHGDSTLTAGVGSTTAEIVVSTGTIDTDLEGPRGAMIRYVDAGGIERSVTLLGAASGVLFLDELASAAVPSGNTMIVGALEHHWESPWFDTGNPERKKQAHYLNLIFRKESIGTLLVQVFADFDEAITIPGQTIDLAEARHQIVLGQLPGTWFKIRLTNPFPTVGLQYELVSLVWRSFDEDQD